jgi:hypothetical protein
MFSEDWTVKRFSFSMISLLCIATAIGIGSSDIGPSALQEPSPDMRALIRTVAEKETELHNLWLQYTYRQTTTLAFYGSFGREDFKVVSEVLFRDSGRREIQVVEQHGELSHVFWGIGVDDVLANLQPFVLTLKELPHYLVDYRGSGRFDSMDCHLFFLLGRKRKHACREDHGKTDSTGGNEQVSPIRHP